MPAVALERNEAFGQGVRDSPKASSHTGGQKDDFHTRKGLRSLFGGGRRITFLARDESRRCRFFRSFENDKIAGVNFLGNLAGGPMITVRQLTGNKLRLFRKTGAVKTGQKAE